MKFTVIALFTFLATAIAIPVQSNADAVAIDNKAPKLTAAKLRHDIEKARLDQQRAVRKAKHDAERAQRKAKTQLLTNLQQQKAEGAKLKAEGAKLEAEGAAKKAAGAAEKTSATDLIASLLAA